MLTETYFSAADERTCRGLFIIVKYCHYHT